VGRLLVAECDTNRYRGKATIDPPLLGKPALVINGRNQTKPIDGLDRQVVLVRAAMQQINRATSAGDGAVSATVAALAVRLRAASDPVRCRIRPSAAVSPASRSSRALGGRGRGCLCGAGGYAAPGSPSQ
jgi:hypothetical protein